MVLRSTLKPRVPKRSKFVLARSPLPQRRGFDHAGSSLRGAVLCWDLKRDPNATHVAPSISPKLSLHG